MTDVDDVGAGRPGDRQNALTNVGGDVGRHGPIVEKFQEQATTAEQHGGDSKRHNPRVLLGIGCPANVISPRMHVRDAEMSGSP